MRGGRELVIWGSGASENFLAGGTMNRRFFLRNANMAAISLAAGGGLLGCVEKACGRGDCGGRSAGKFAGDGLSSAEGEGFGGAGDSDGGGSASVSALGISCGEGDGGGDGGGA